MFDREPGQRLVDAVVHLGSRHGGVLQAERDLALDGAVDRLRLDVLEDQADPLRKPRDGRSKRVQSGDGGRA